MHVFRNILGIFVFDSNNAVQESHLFGSIEEFRNSDEQYEKLKSSRNAKEPDEKQLNKILEYFRNPEFMHKLREQNTNLSRIDIRNSVNCDALVSQAINSHDEIDKVVNALIKRLRDWYRLYNPEISVKIENNIDFCNAVSHSSKEQLLSQFNVSENKALGADLGEKDVSQIVSLAKSALSLQKEKENLQAYIETMMKSNYPNINEVAGPMIGAKLLEHSGSLKRLAGMPSSTVQILGAETALFRHLKTGARPPRHGLIVNHPYIARVSEKSHGKVARSLADKISIAAKVDYFKGEFIGVQLREQLEKKLAGIK